MGKSSNNSGLSVRTSGTWHRAERCIDSGCVEAKRVGDTVFVRSSKDPDGARVSYDLEEWGTFISAVKAGEFDIA